MRLLWGQEETAMDPWREKQEVGGVGWDEGAGTVTVVTKVSSRSQTLGHLLAFDSQQAS